MKKKFILPVTKNRKMGNTCIYGDYLFFYEGEGGLLTDTNNVSRDCSFKVWQLMDGRIVLVCEFSNSVPFSTLLKAIKFHGKTNDGIELLAEGEFSQANDLGKISSEKIVARTAFWINELVAKKPSYNMEFITIGFGITNFFFIGEKTKFERGFHLYSLPLTLNDEFGATNLTINRCNVYEELKEKIITLKSVGVTCEIVIEANTENRINQLKIIIDNLAYILSIASGTKIQWIYCNYYNGENKIIKRFHHSKITKKYCPLSVIDTSKSKLTLKFIEESYKSFVSKNRKIQLKKELIDTYLEAKSEHDFLETRGVKLAVTLEQLKYNFIEQNNSPVSEYVIDEEEYEKELLPELWKSLNKILKDYNKSLNGFSQEKLKNLNRRSFKSILSKLLKEINLKPSSRDLDLFIRVRNSLIHTGYFYCKVATKKGKVKTPSRICLERQYFFMISFVDRIILKALDYYGEYIDRQIPGKPENKRLE